MDQKILRKNRMVGRKLIKAELHSAHHVFVFVLQ